MNLEQFYTDMKARKHVEAGSELFETFHKLSQEALKITAEINSKYHTPQKLRKLFSKLTGKKVDDTFGMFPPFYTDCGKNITIGKNVFINACCHFQDQGGIEIGDGALIGHNVTIATLNHDFDPEKRGNITPSSVKIGKNVWIGSDSTILPGVTIGEDAYAMTITLLMNSEGKKMGKTAKGAVWLDPNKTTPFEFYQYWRNVDDADVMKCIKMLTFIPMNEINEIENWEDSRINEKKELLAYHLTELVHGKDEADKAQAAAKALFSGSGDSENMPKVEIIDADLADGKIDILNLLIKCKFAQSRGEAKRLIQQGGITVADSVINTMDKVFTPDDLKEGLIVRKGKKHFCKAIYQ